MIELKHTPRRQTAQLADLGDAEIDIRLQALVASCGQMRSCVVAGPEDDSLAARTQSRGLIGF
jgi:hypothetical protein